MFISMFLLFNTIRSACDANNKCGSASPCCSEYGFCGTGYNFCGGGCNAIGSFKPSSCTSKPKCKSGKLSLTPQRMVSTEKYDGDSSKADFTFDGDVKAAPTQNGNGLALLSLIKGKNGAKISTTQYLDHGKITSRIRTSKGPGVITSFILMSDSKDEVDFEFIGANLREAQTNYFVKGNLDHNQGGKHPITSNSDTNWHTYTIDYQSTYISWYIDGQLIRTVRKGAKGFPNTPVRAQWGIWNGGDGEEGTRQWAGGRVNWNSEQTRKGFYAIVESVYIQCI